MKISVIVIALLVAVAASGCISGSEPGAERPAATETPPSTGEQVPSTGAPDQRENSEAGVTITAVYLGNNAFNIKMDTHSGSLDYEMAKISYVRDSRGNIIRPESWDGGTGGHHFSGTLKFPGFDDRSGFELVIQNVAGIEERVLKW